MQQIIVAGLYRPESGLLHALIIRPFARMGE